MDDRIYYIKISPEVIKGDLFKVNFNVGTITGTSYINECCVLKPIPIEITLTGSTYVYSSMTEILSGGTYNSVTNQFDSLLTGLTVPILLTENTIDIGYYSVFDGMMLQKETMTNFLFSANTNDPYTYYFYNTSDTEFKKYLEFSQYYVDWGDGNVNTITTSSPSYYTHTYPQTTGITYTISMSGMSPWGSNVIKKDVTPPFTNIVDTNPNGTAYFIAAGGGWSGTPLSYNYIFSGDESCDVYENSSHNYTTVPFLITGYTKSSVNDLQVYGAKADLVEGKFKVGVPVTISSGVTGIYSGTSTDGLYVGYSINGIDYYDYPDGTTIFATYSSGLTPDMMICSAITKNEVLLNVIDEVQIQSNVYVERGKLSALERLERLGEVDNLGDLVKYGYGFFNISDI
jgi:hypothetical protein